MPATLRIAAVLVALAVSGPASAGQPFGVEIALATRADALIREAVSAQPGLWRLMAAVERLDRDGLLCPGIPVC